MFDIVLNRLILICSILFHFISYNLFVQECNDDESREQLEETRHTWNLIHALWGQLCDLEDSMMDLDQATGVCFCRMEKKVKKILSQTGKL